MKKIFLDTNVLLALYDTYDICHKSAVQLFKQTNNANTIFVLTTFILAEAISLISQRVSKQTAIALLEELHTGNYIIIHPTEQIVHKAETILKSSSKKDLSYVDSISFAIMEDNNLKKVLTFDRHFKDYGFIREGIDN